MRGENVPRRPAKAQADSANKPAFQADLDRNYTRGLAMLRRLTGAVAFVCFFSIASAPVAESDPARSASMQFALQREAGPCADKCRTWVSATGMIKADTVRDLEALAAKHDLRGLTLVLNSEGGSVHGALALGRLIRKLGMTTTVGRTVESRSKSGSSEATLVPRADCESMCAFVLLAGSKRWVPDEARVRVHQIWLGDRRDDATAASYSAEDLVLVQRDIGKLAQYTVEMGGTIELLETSLRIPPWEPMKALTREELRRMKLDNAESPDTQPAEPVISSANPATTGSVRRMSGGGERAGWAMVERGGVMALTRRHPLTIEGETIGSFDVSISCGEKPNEYRLIYEETRRGRGDAAPAALREVQVRLGSKTLTLALNRSELAANAAERSSSATAILSAPMVSGFAANASRSLSVGTLVADNTTTNIRVGNTGAAQHFPQLATTCAQGRTEHAGLKAN
jgi:hypothetical protein